METYDKVGGNVHVLWKLEVGEGGVTRRYKVGRRSGTGVSKSMV